MTEWRAADLIRRIKVEETAERYVDRHKAFDLAIKALEEIQQYREIGTVEELKKLKESNLSGLELAMIAVSIEKLEQYEDLEKQGKLLKLPCAVGDEVWYIDKYADLYTEIVRGVVDGYLWYRTCGFALNIVWDKPIMGHFGYKRKEMPFLEIDKTVFLTKESAEAALKEMSE